METYIINNVYLIFDYGCVRTIVVWKQYFRVSCKLGTKALRENHSGMETGHLQAIDCSPKSRCVRTIVVWKHTPVLLFEPKNSNSCVRTIVVWKQDDTYPEQDVSFPRCVRTIVVWKLPDNNFTFIFFGELRKNHSGMETVIAVLFLSYP